MGGGLLCCRFGGLRAGSSFEVELEPVTACLRHGRLAVGTEYGLKKLVPMQNMTTPKERMESARTALQKITANQVVLPAYMRIALQKLSGEK